MIRALTLAAALFPVALAAEDADKTFTLAAPPALLESGLLDYILPRFSLKTGVRITLGEDGGARFGDTGRAAFTGPATTWKIDPGGDPDAIRFADWLRSDVGRRTVDAFVVDGEQPFTSEVTETTTVAALRFDGDPVLGETLSHSHCGRCHVVSEKNRMGAIGSTPSFAVLRTLGNWQDRFAAFYTLNPHPAFTQVAEVTPPFDPQRPSPITPVTITLEELDAILAYVSGLVPADLGAPIQSR